MKNIVVATHKNVGYYEILEESCKKNNIELVTLGLGQKWTGFTMRYQLYFEYLKKLPDDEIVMISDAYDVVILRDAKDIKEEFLKFNKKIVFSCENTINNKLYQPSCSNNHTINNGNIIGYVGYLKKLLNIIYKYQHLWKKFYNDDMIVINNVCNLEKKFFDDNCILDYECKIFIIAGYFNILFLNVKCINNKIFNTKHKNFPCVIHFPGFYNGNHILKCQGYDTSNVLLHNNFTFRVNQIFNMCKVIIKRNFFLILLVIIIIIKYNKKPAKNLSRT